MLRGLSYYWRTNLAVAAGAAVACAVLTGALLVGDSVRGSLRDLTLQRLGATDQAVVAEGFFRAELAQELATRLSGSGAGPGASHPDSSSETENETSPRAVPILVLPAGAVHAETRARASGANLLAVDEAFLDLYPGELRGRGWDALAESASPGGSPVVLNETLAGELGAEVGDAVLVSFTRAAEVPRSSLLGRRDAGEVVQTLRLTVAATVPDRGPGSFGLAPHQGTPSNAFVPLATLRRALGRDSGANAILLAGDLPQGDGAEALAAVLKLEDVGLHLESSDEGWVEVTSDRFVLRPATADAIETAARGLGGESLSFLTYLANHVRLEAATAGEPAASFPYSTLTALDPPPAGSPFGTLREPSGKVVEDLAAGEILLNTWAAADLGAVPGDSVEVEYFVVGEREDLRTERRSFRVAAVVTQQGLSADRTLTPEYPGISDADRISDWDPPFPVDLDAIGPADEQYWEDWRGTPKAFVSLGEGQEMWRSRFGELTGVRVALPAAAEGEEAPSPQAFSASLRASLEGSLNPQANGLRVLPIKDRSLEAAGGANPFGALFLGFSWFLIVSAVLLVALLFTLGVEQRAREVGLLKAVGFPPAQVRRRFLQEGLILAALGALVGLAGAVGYAWLMMAGLRTWWRGAVGTSDLYLHVAPVSLALGWLISVAVTGFAIALALRRLKRLATPALLAGSATPPPKAGSGRRARRLAWGAAVLALALLAYAVVSGQVSSPGLAFGLGALLLVAGLAAFAAWCRSYRPSGLTGGAAGWGALASLGVRNSARNPGRSMLSVSLVAAACFVIVVVAANRRTAGDELLEKDSGAGGFALLARSDVPVFQDLGSAEGRLDLGLSSQTEEALDGAEVIQLATVPGDDASCLNLYQPESPRLLGVSAGMIQRGGFSFQQQLAVSEGSPENPWSLLQADLGPDPDADDGVPVIPAIGDYEAVTWILKAPLGSEVAMTDEAGNPLRLRIVATLHSSIFQSEVLISEANLRRFFPSREGFSTFLLAPAGEGPGEVRERAAALSEALEADLADFGFDAISTADQLARFQAVQNTYLSTFQTLGGLGLLLGTFGLAIVLIRNVLERLAELAALRAFGFRRRTLSRMVLLENAFLLLLGLSLGSGAALVAAAPYLLVGGAPLPWASLALTLGAIAAIGIAACAAAASGSLRTALLPALKEL